LFWWVLILAVGVWGYSYATVAPAREPFPFAAFLAFVAGALWASTMRSRAKQKWLWMLVPFVALGILNWQASKAAHSLAQDTVSELILRYALWAFGILVLSLVWAAVSPNEASVNLDNYGYHIPWLRISWAAGCATVLFVGFEAIHCFNDLHKLQSSDQLRTLQISLARAGLAVYFFVALKALLPRTISQLVAATGERPSLPRRSRIQSQHD
jgi:hypothetical protein